MSRTALIFVSATVKKNRNNALDIERLYYPQKDGKIKAISS